jgi:hypothetical protein
MMIPFSEDASVLAYSNYPVSDCPWMMIPFSEDASVLAYSNYPVSDFPWRPFAGDASTLGSRKARTPPYAHIREPVVDLEGRNWWGREDIGKSNINQLFCKYFLYSLYFE